MSDNASPEEQQRLIALKYDGKTAPKVVAKGFGTLAEELLAIAEENDLLIHKDKELSRFLQQLDVGQEIPKELYVVIAELIAFAYVLQGKFPDKWRNIHGRVETKI